MWEDPGPSGESISSSLSEFCILVEVVQEGSQQVTGEVVVVTDARGEEVDGGVQEGSLQVTGEVVVVTAAREEEEVDGGVAEGERFTSHTCRDKVE
ncbi:hypothetical protein Pcinc_002379 [Petrolisthes cinctipes]|uniref:Uncharacterized protein n=1 Tax=Petrolisthes cinctipes TaxID=88211 RepID=A0AAE1L2C2_PETCI|nr:hypothetical protein Pcinc_002379 [Petrolisthes cinctipes]